MSLPDGPRTPRLLQLLHWIARPLNFLETHAQRYGDTFTVHWSGFRPVVMLSNPQAIQELFTQNPRHFESASGNAILQPIVGANSLLLLEGDRHERDRRMLMPPFHGERMRAYGQTICEITQQVLRQQATGQPFAVRPVMQDITLRVILEAVFGLSQGERFEQLRPLLAELLELVGSPLSSSLLFFRFMQRDLGAWSPWGRFRQRQQQIDALIYAEIAERRQHFEPDRQDILTLMLLAQDAAGQGMTDAELRDELLTLLFAGHETTASALAWAFYWIHHQPQIQAKLLAELATPNPDPIELARLPYLNAVCQETLRIYPVAMLTFARVARVPVKIMEQTFEAGTVLVPCIYLVHHRPDLYPEPDQFKPERFLERHFSPYEFLPFGGSNRRCLGMAFALFEMKLVLATTLQHFQVQLAPSGPVRPMRRGVTLVPSANLQISCTPQAQPVPVML